jgi:hypothetical protein
VVRGDTYSHKNGLKALGGTYNKFLRGGGGWIFSKSQRGKVEAFLRPYQKQGGGAAASGESSGAGVDEAGAPATAETDATHAVSEPVSAPSTPVKSSREDGAALWIEEFQGSPVVLGDTYRHKAELKRMGGSWNSEKKGWAFGQQEKGRVQTYIDGVNAGEGPLCEGTGVATRACGSFLVLRPHCYSREGLVPRIGETRRPVATNIPLALTRPHPP